MSGQSGIAYIHLTIGDFGACTKQAQCPRLRLRVLFALAQKFQEDDDADPEDPEDSEDSEDPEDSEDSEDLQNLQNLQNRSEPF